MTGTKGADGAPAVYGAICNLGLGGRRRVKDQLWPVVAMVLLVACARQPQVDLSTKLKGITKAQFLACSGPPILEMPQPGQDRMSFVTNLRRGAVIGVTGPTAAPVESCSVDAVFEQDRLVTASFGGSDTMCQMVFTPCLDR